MAGLIMDKKGIIALVICGIILVLYFPVILPRLSPQPTEQELAERENANNALNQGGVTDGLTPARPTGEESYQQGVTGLAMQGGDSVADSAEVAQADDVRVPLQDHIVLQNENIVTVWTNEGAALKSVVLKRYKNSDKSGRLELIRSMTDEYLPLTIARVRIHGNNGYEDIQLSNSRFRVIGNTKDRASFQLVLHNGIQITKNVSLDSDNNHVSMEIVLRNSSGSALTCEYQLVAASGVVHEGDYNVDIGTVVGIDKGNGSHKLVKTTLKKLPEQNESVGISWVGSVNKYFAAVLVPESRKWIYSVDSQAISGDADGVDDFMIRAQIKPVSIPHGGEVRQGYRFYLGPKIEKTLQNYGLDTLLGFGMFKVISRILLKVLNGFYNIIPNYGIAILFMTFLVKLILFPLTRKSQVSMYKMQGLQPKIEELKKKYKSDKQGMARAQMDLFKKNGANPLGGCLPMLLQLPVFFALFRTLQLSFEMRQAPFTLWITDLSLPDTLLTLPFTLPVLGNMLNILPIIMTGASFVQMRLNPKSPSADPQARMQQKMMSFMPLMFCFILYKMPSGLTLYWTASTIFGIGENLYNRKSMQKIKKKA